MIVKTKIRIPTKVTKVCKWLGKEIVSGVVVAAAVAIGTQLVMHSLDREQEKKKLESIYLGLNKQYVDSMLGVPVVETAEGKGTRSYYKLADSVVSCSYRDDEIVAFFVFVKSGGKLYRIPYNFYITEPTYLTQFSYSDFSKQVENFKANCPANNDDYAYYIETYYGANAAQYNYYLIGSYKNYYDNAYVPLISNALIDNSEFYGTPEHEATRKRAKPNVFGMIESSYIDEIDLLLFDENLQIYCNTIFNGWYK